MQAVSASFRYCLTWLRRLLLQHKVPVHVCSETLCSQLVFASALFFMGISCQGCTDPFAVSAEKVARISERL